ncbi:DNA/RNA non-specific endonuclease [Solirubrobacter phytolaccae]|uniref:DNA/RNA non-specific endonuclease n=2 Tax=Solirubrobacter phytolaccae TaxID=1404360 RepID=A0A9X3N5R0_9ACTN|nr:DNA/RNA non-specific endonuclease [Solirubrobacter phytolaccae]
MHDPEEQAMRNAFLAGIRAAPGISAESSTTYILKQYLAGKPGFDGLFEALHARQTADYTGSLPGKEARDRSTTYDTLHPELKRIAAEPSSTAGSAYVERVRELESEYKKSARLMPVLQELAIAQKNQLGPLVSFASKYDGAYRDAAPNAPLLDRIFTLLAWHTPLFSDDSKGVNDQRGLRRSIGLALLAEANQLAGLANPLDPQQPLRNLLPAKARDFGTLSQENYALPPEAEIDTRRAVRSGIITAMPGAILSGEESDGRLLERHLIAAFAPWGAGNIVAGHLVAGSLGGGNVDSNLAPLLGTFNTGDHGMRAPETAAATKLRAGEVIYYETTVTYGPILAPDGWEYQLPVTVTVVLRPLELKEGGNRTEIDDYTVAKDSRTWVLPHAWPTGQTQPSAPQGESSDRKGKGKRPQGGSGGSARGGKRTKT